MLIKRNMVKVPGFFASRKSGASTTNSKSAQKPPMVVVCSGKPSSEVIRPDKESVSNFPSANIAPDF